MNSVITLPTLWITTPTQCRKLLFSRTKWKLPELSINKIYPDYNISWYNELQKYLCILGKAYLDIKKLYFEAIANNSKQHDWRKICNNIEEYL